MEPTKQELDDYNAYLDYYDDVFDNPQKMEELKQDMIEINKNLVTTR